MSRCAASLLSPVLEPAEKPAEAPPPRPPTLRIASRTGLEDGPAPFGEPHRVMAHGRVEQDRRWSEWMALAQNGGQAVYAQLLKECLPLVRAVVARRLGRPDEDVVQDALLTLHRVRHTYDPRRPFTPWLAAIVDRRCIDAIRRRSRVRAHETRDERRYEGYADPASGRSAEHGADAEQVRALLDVLPPGQRQALELLKLRELSLAEASAVSGQTTGALKVSAHRALKALKARLGGAP